MGNMIEQDQNDFLNTDKWLSILDQLKVHRETLPTELKTDEDSTKAIAAAERRKQLCEEAMAELAKLDAEVTNYFEKKKEIFND